MKNATTKTYTVTTNDTTFAPAAFNSIKDAVGYAAAIAKQVASGNCVTINRNSVAIWAYTRN